MSSSRSDTNFTMDQIVEYETDKLPRSVIFRQWGQRKFNILEKRSRHTDSRGYCKGSPKLPAQVAQVAAQQYYFKSHEFQ
ncbi:hypothetical protein D910_01598, partial [Dendroctonus ponderosae]